MEPLTFALLIITLALASISGIFLKSITEEEIEPGKRYFSAFFWIFTILAGLFLPLIPQIAYYIGVSLLFYIEHKTQHKKTKSNDHDHKNNHTNPRKILIITSPLFVTMESILFFIVLHMLYTTQIQGVHNLKLYLNYAKEHWLFWIFAVVKLASMFFV
jgi:hypothetical protein